MSLEEVRITGTKQKVYVIRKGDTPNELCHYKYIDKKKVNGKWRYYYNESKNIYDTNASNYDSKVAKVKQTQEWQDIVRRKDPEYVRTNADGTTEYLIDDYLVKKKHPELDALDDLGSGRKISLNKFDKGSTIAGLKDYVKTGQMVVAVAAKALTEKFKLQQGTYKDEINASSNVVNEGIKFLNRMMKS